jgi:hypothetical protein
MTNILFYILLFLLVLWKNKTKIKKQTKRFIIFKKIEGGRFNLTPLYSWIDAHLIVYKIVTCIYDKKATDHCFKTNINNFVI